MECEFELKLEWKFGLILECVFELKLEWKFGLILKCVFELKLECEFELKLKCEFELKLDCEVELKGEFELWFWGWEKWVCRSLSWVCAADTINGKDPDWQLVAAVLFLFVVQDSFWRAGK